MSTPTLPPYTVAELTQLYQDNRTSVLNEIVRCCYANILELVAIGKQQFTVDHVYLQSQWAQDAQFRADVVSALQALFPGSTVEMVLQEPMNYCISFAYTPSP